MHVVPLELGAFPRSKPGGIISVKSTRMERRSGSSLSTQGVRRHRDRMIGELMFVRLPVRWE